MIEWFQTQLGFSVLLMTGLITVLMTTVAYAMFYERKVAAWTQDRHGPNRVGPRGLLQPIADGLKALLKEDIIPDHVDRPLFLLAPILMFSVSLIGFAVVPWGGPIVLPGGAHVHVQVASLDIGLLYVLAVGSMTVYGIVLGGWASNNKYSFYGAMRAAAQVLSYEIPMGLAILVVVLTCGELRLERIVDAQIGPHGSGWNVLLQPVACFLLLVTMFAEANRAPFDLAEAEQELVGGYHTEYSAMKFAMFFLAEYAHMLTASAVMVVLFFGGWELFPFSGRLGWAWLDWIHHSTDWRAAPVRFAILYAKVIACVFVYMWVRWTLPRFRFDQLMRLAWKGMVPVGLAVVAVAAMLVYGGRAASWWAPAANALVLVAALLWLARTPAAVTGRQPHLPPVPTKEGAS